MGDCWQRFAQDHLKPLLSRQAELYQYLEEKVDARVLERAKNGNTGEKDVKIIIGQLHDYAQSQSGAKDEADRRKIGRRLIISKIQRLAVWADKFLITFSGIAAIVKAVDEQYGGIVYGTLALFLTVARNKELHKILTANTLDRICDWLPRLDVISKVEKKNDTVMRFVFDVYQRTVDFLRDATKYLAQSWFVRTCKVIARPPELYLKDQVEELKEKTKALLEELFLAQYGHLCGIKQNLSRLVENTNQTNVQLAEQQSENRQERLRKISSTLELPLELKAGPETMIQDCIKIYAGMFSEHRDKAASPPVKLQKISLRLLNDRPRYSEWKWHQTSSLFLLGGENYSYNVSESWLSPVVVEFYLSVKGLPNTLAMFHSINAVRARRRKDPEAEILLLLKSILYQLLKQSPKLCQNWQDSIAHEYSKSVIDHSTRDPIDGQINALFKLLSKVLSSDSNKHNTYYILLDGLERLSAPAPETLLAGFLDVLDNPEVKGRIKMLVTCDSTTFQNEIRSPKDRDGLRHALGQGGNRQAMNRVFSDFWKQSRLDESFRNCSLRYCASQ